MSKVVERFLKYTAYDTQSEDKKCSIPSTEKQWKLAYLLAEELREMGAENVRVSKNCYVYATIPANIDRNVAKVGFIAHMDTAPSLTGDSINPRKIVNYDGEDICLNKEKNIIMKVSDFPFLKKYVGKDLITTDGTTLLGGDDKAGVAEIMTMAEYLLTHPEFHHGPVQIGFTPDEEVGHGADLFDVSGFEADFAYTVDGGELGEIEYENFNAASAEVRIHGFGIHPGASKNRMKNSALLGMEFQALLPVFENPMYTEGYEGFFHLAHISGDVEETVLEYLIRDHDKTKFEQKKNWFCAAADFMNQKYGPGTVDTVIRDSYFNMREKIEPHMELIDIVKTAMAELDIVPIIKPVRGGTDGARLSFMGLPCPNLCTGSRNSHGRYEFACIQDMEKIVELLIRIVEKFGINF